MQRMCVRAFVLVNCWVWALPFAAAQGTKSCDAVPVDKTVCSYTGLNGNCTITIDRMNPITPPTVYAKPDAKIKVVVINPSPYEKLYLDWKSTTAAVPPDSFATVFSALTGTLGKFTAVETHGQVALLRGAAEISQDQQKLLKEIQGPLITAKPALELIKKVLEPPPLGVCSTDPDTVKAWLDPDGWKNDVKSTLQKAIGEAAQSEAVHSSADLQLVVTALGKEIQTLVSASASDLVVLNLNQLTIVDAMSQRKDLGARLAALLSAVDLIPSPAAGLKPVPEIVEFPSKDKTYQSQVWVLNYANKLAPVVKKVSAQSSSSDAGSLGSLADTPTKQALVTLTVQFQSPPRVEVSTGLMVPLTPYHSYSTAAVATNGTITGNVVQETRTYTVVPMVSVNVLVKDFIAKQQRAAWFGSVAVGYNPATSSVEFGVGPSFSWRSIVFSGFVDIGRDTQLAGGFTVGQMFPAGNPPKPLTTTVWSVKPAAVLSIRIPLGGASK
jgi:hypothetical protein